MKVYILKDTLHNGQSHVCVNVNVNVDVVSVVKHLMQMQSMQNLDGRYRVVNVNVDEVGYNRCW